MNPDDAKRDAILRFLHVRHKTTKSISKLPIGIRDLQSEMKKQHGMKQADVASNLDYLIQVQWVREVVKERDFTTRKGMTVSQEQVKYKISDTGINHLESGSVFRRPHAASHVNITNIKGVTVLGDGNIVNARFTDLSRAIDELEGAVAESGALSDEQKLEASADLSTIRAQIAKQNPERTILGVAWKSLKAIAAVGEVASAAERVGHLIAGLLAAGPR
jgi:hypothetical protein